MNGSSLFRDEPGLTVLSWGAGQDSTALLFKIIHDHAFRNIYVRGRFVVVMSDTGDEHRETYEYIEYCREVFERYGIEFHFLTNDKGYHTETWSGLIDYYRSHKVVGSKVFRKSCTGNLKILPIYRWLSDYVRKNYNPEPSGKKYRDKQPLVDYARDNGKIRIIIGFAKGEEKRVPKPGSDPPWAQLALDKRYPLLTVGMDRAACQDYIQSVGYKVPIPSNCMRCPFLSEEELLWLYRFRREIYDEFVELERIKIENNQHMGEKNYGVWPNRLLPHVLEDAQRKHGHMTDEALWEYKMSHGHSVASKY